MNAVQLAIRRTVIILALILISTAIAGNSAGATRNLKVPAPERTFSPTIREMESPAGKIASKRANFQGIARSRNSQRMADWVVDSQDNSGMPFIIVDKVEATVFVFEPCGKLKGWAPALLGLAKVDDSIPGIGNRLLSAITPQERTTPAGRFEGLLGHNTDGSNVLWVDHSKAVSLHRVITDQPRERRLQRLATPSPTDNRISYGCINVPVKFFDDVVRPVFLNKRGIIYVLPEVKPLQEIFESYYDVD